jgi:hypothetical protein
MKEEERSKKRVFVIEEKDGRSMGSMDASFRFLVNRS